MYITLPSILILILKETFTKAYEFDFLPCYQRQKLDWNSAKWQIIYAMFPVKS